MFVPLSQLTLQVPDHELLIIRTKYIQKQKI